MAEGMSAICNRACTSQTQPHKLSHRSTIPTMHLLLVFPTHYATQPLQDNTKGAQCQTFNFCSDPGQAAHTYLILCAQHNHFLHHSERLGQLEKVMLESRTSKSPNITTHHLLQTGAQCSRSKTFLRAATATATVTQHRHHSFYAFHNFTTSQPLFCPVHATCMLVT